MTKEQVYKKQLTELGIYQKAFDPLIDELAGKERLRTRARKEWSATVPKGEKPSFLDPLYQVFVQLDREILTYREQLGLTPKALQKLRGGAAPGGASADSPNGIASRLDALLARAQKCDPVDVSDLDTGALSVTAANGGDKFPGGEAEGTDCHANAAALARNDEARAAEGVGPCEGNNG